MDLCAELTLQVLRFVQQPIDAPCSPLEWVFIPEGRRASWAEARRLLSEAPEPFIVAPIAEPGMIRKANGVWSPGMVACNREHH